MAAGALRGVTPVGDHPSAIAVTRNSHFAFVTNTNDDSVSILDLTRLVSTEVRRISVHLLPGEANGSAPNGSTVDSAQSLVYVADARRSRRIILAGPSRACAGRALRTSCVAPGGVHSPRPRIPDRLARGARFRGPRIAVLLHPG